MDCWAQGQSHSTDGARWATAIVGPSEANASGETAPLQL